VAAPRIDDKGCRGTAGSIPGPLDRTAGRDELGAPPITPGQDLGRAAQRARVLLLQPVGAPDGVDFVLVGSGRAAPRRLLPRVFVGQHAVVGIAGADGLPFARDLRALAVPA